MPDEDTKPAEEIEQTPEGDTQEMAPAEGDQEATTEETPELWSKLFPELPYHELQSHVREAAILKRLETLQTAQAAATAEQPAGESATGSEGEGESPPIPLPPDLDPAALAERVSKAVEGGEPAAIAEAIRTTAQAVKDGMTWTRQLAEAVNDALEEQGDDIRSLKIPAALTEAAGRVPGANQADLQEARRLFLEGETKTLESAVQLAVFRRQQQVPAPKRPVSAEARRKAQALAAAKATVDNEAPQGTEAGIPRNPAEWKARMAQDEERARQK